MQTRDLTKEERAHFNGLQASMPISYRYILVVDHARAGMNPITKSNDPRPLFRVKNSHSVGPEEKILLIDKASMKVCLADSLEEDPALAPIPRPYASDY